MRTLGFLLLGLLMSLPWLPAADAQQNQDRRGRGFGFGRGGHGRDARHDADREVFQFLLTNHDKITRRVRELPDGVETLTESDDEEVASQIKDHVEWMQHRIEDVNPIRMRDPLFAEIFQHADEITMVHVETEKGVRVTETSDDPYVAKLIQAHAKVVSQFVENGFAEAMKNHSVPDDAVDSPRTVEDASDTQEEKRFPLIDGHGSVVRLPDAIHQPRSGAKLMVDITSGSDPAKLHPAIQYVAKFANIYAGAGKEPVDAKIAVVLHGGGTLTVLNDEAYAKKFNVDANPNLELLHLLHEAGVELCVCGQSLNAAGYDSMDTVVFVDTAVSALTAVVNLQADGFSYVPL
ncbi:DsrE family protein, partial [Rhodopirellula sallentina]